VRDDRESLTQGELEFTLWLGPLPVRWTAAHEPGPTEHSFIDRMVKGPLASWVHEHRLDPDPKGVRLSDRIMYTYHPGVAGWPARLLFSRPGLKFLFWYRHWRTRKGSLAMAVEPTPGWGSNEG
jgi:ligand-binding SRPBCC domain-containing protein